MPNASKSQPYDPTALQWVHGQDLTDVRAPTGQIISGVACLLIPEGHLDKVAVDWLVAEFRAGPGRNAKKAICHKCYDERNHVLWDPKPASLKRHLYHHYQIKCYACKASNCVQLFLTKDQAVVHIMGHHKENKEMDRKTAATYVVSLYDS